MAASSDTQRYPRPELHACARVGGRARPSGCRPRSRRRWRGGPGRTLLRHSLRLRRRVRWAGGSPHRPLRRLARAVATRGHGLVGRTGPGSRQPTAILSSNSSPRASADARHRPARPSRATPVIRPALTRLDHTVIQVSCRSQPAGGATGHMGGRVAPTHCVGTPPATPSRNPEGPAYPVASGASAACLVGGICPGLSAARSSRRM